MSGVASGTSAKEQVGRLLRVVPYLHSHGQVRLDQAAADLGISDRQLVRDLRVLFMCGLPGGYPDDLIDVDIDALTDPDGDRVIRVSNADYLQRPLRLSVTEATALIVALRALRGGATDGATQDVVDRALAKLEQACADGAAPVNPIDPGERTALPTRSVVEQALAAGRQLEIDYFVPARDEEASRVIDPSRLVERGGAAYLLAWCHSADAPRSFRLDRIRQARLLDSSVTDAERVPAELADGFFTPADATTTVTLQLAPQARWVTEYYATSAPRPVGPGGPDGWVEADLDVADPRWLTRLLLRLAPYARVAAPAGADKAALDAAREALRLYDAGA